MQRTGDYYLDDVCVELKRMENIDVFNNAVAWAYLSDIWDRMGRPQNIINNVYAVSPWFAAFKRKLAETNDMNSHT